MASRKSRFTIEVSGGDEFVGSDKRQKRDGRWAFDAATFIVPMGYAVPADDDHIRLPERAREEGVRDYHCTIIVAGNSVRIDMTPDAIVYVDGRQVTDLSWIMAGKSECTLRLGQRKGFPGSANPEFTLKLRRDEYAKMKDPELRRVIAKSIKRGRKGGSIGLANRAYNFRHGLRALTVGLIAMLGAGGLYARQEAEASRKVEASIEEMALDLLDLDDGQKRIWDVLPIDFQAFENYRDIERAVRQVVAVRIAPDGEETIIGLGAAWLCCDGLDLGRRRWVTNVHVMEAAQREADKGLMVGMVKTSLRGSTRRANEFYQIRRTESRFDYDEHRNFLKMRGLVALRRNERTRKEGRAVRSDLLNPFDIAAFDVEDSIVSIAPLKLASSESISQLRTNSQIVTVGYPVEGSQFLENSARDGVPRAVSGQVVRITGATGAADVGRVNPVILVGSETNGGISGSPVLNADGEVVGLVGSALTVDVLDYSSNLKELDEFSATGAASAATAAKVNTRLALSRPSVFAYHADLVRQMLDPDARVDPDLPDMKDIDEYRHDMLIPVLRGYRNAVYRYGGCAAEGADKWSSYNVLTPGGATPKFDPDRNVWVVRQQLAKQWRKGLIMIVVPDGDKTSIAARIVATREDAFQSYEQGRVSGEASGLDAGAVGGEGGSPEPVDIVQAGATDSLEEIEETRMFGNVAIFILNQSESGGRKEIVATLDREATVMVEALEVGCGEAQRRR